MNILLQIMALVAFGVLGAIRIFYIVKAGDFQSLSPFQYGPQAVAVLLLAIVGIASGIWAIWIPFSIEFVASFIMMILKGVKVL